MVVTKPAAYPVGHPFAPPLEAVRGVPGVSSVTFPNCGSGLAIWCLQTEEK